MIGRFEHGRVLLFRLISICFSLMNTDILFSSVVISKGVKYPRYRPTWLRGVQQVKAPQISRHSAHEGGKVVTPTYRPPLPPGISLVLIFRG